jgi:hypothetical protein
VAGNDSARVRLYQASGVWAKAIWEKEMNPADRMSAKKRSFAKQKREQDIFIEDGFIQTLRRTSALCNIKGFWQLSGPTYFF